MTGEAINQMALLDALKGGRCLTIEALDTDLDLDRKTIAISAGRLIKRGLAERVEAGCYRLTAAGCAFAESGKVLKSGTPLGRRKIPFCRDTLRQRAWNAMRMGEAFSVPELVMVASAGGEKDAANNLQRFCARLCKAGYLVKLPRNDRVHGKRQGAHRYRLIDDTGPKAPAYRPSSGALFDFNSKEERPCR